MKITSMEDILEHMPNDIVSHVLGHTPRRYVELYFESMDVPEIMSVLRMSDYFMRMSTDELVTFINAYRS